MWTNPSSFSFLCNLPLIVLLMVNGTDSPLIPLHSPLSKSSSSVVFVVVDSIKEPEFHIIPINFYSCCPWLLSEFLIKSCPRRSCAYRPRKSGTMWERVFAAVTVNYPIIITFNSSPLDLLIISTVVVTFSGPPTLPQLLLLLLLPRLTPCAASGQLPWGPWINSSLLRDLFPILFAIAPNNSRVSFVPCKIRRERGRKENCCWCFWSRERGEKSLLR